MLTMMRLTIPKPLDEVSNLIFGPLITIIEHSVKFKMSEIDVDYLSVLIEEALRAVPCLIKMGDVLSYFSFESYMEDYICETFYEKKNFAEIMGYVETTLIPGRFQYMGHTDDMLLIGVELL